MNDKTSTVPGDKTPPTATTTPAPEVTETPAPKPKKFNHSLKPQPTPQKGGSYSADSLETEDDS